MVTPNQKPLRPWRERVTEGFDRSRIRQEVLMARRPRFRKLRNRYGSMFLGASLAVGGIGIPVVINRDATEAAQTANFGEELGLAQQIAREVAGGVSDAVPFGGTILELTEQQANLISETAREEFFRTEVPFGSLIYSEAKKNDLDPALVAAVVQTESNFRPTARSGVGASGLMQLMPRTGKWMGANNLMNPAENVRAGTKYLKYLNERFDNDETKVLAAYNAGEGNVRRYGGVPPFRETRNYVEKVAKAQGDFEAKVEGKVAEAMEKGASTAARAFAVAR